MADNMPLLGNPFLAFDPSQMADPYAPYKGQIPGTSYIGWPADAQGNPIGAPAGMQIGAPAQMAAAAPAPAQAPAPAPLGMTINSPPAAAQAQGGIASTPAIQELLGNYAAAQAAMTPQQRAIEAQNNALRQQMLGAPATGGGGLGQSPGGAFNPGAAYSGLPSPAAAAPQIAAAAPAAAAPAAPATNNAGLTAQQYLALRANPGHVTTPGATVPVSPNSYQPNNNVLQQFLASWKPAQSGPGSGFQQAFAKILGGAQNA